jgi:hypothetical protein
LARLIGARVKNKCDTQRLYQKTYEHGSAKEKKAEQVEAVGIVIIPKENVLVNAETEAKAKVSLSVYLNHVRQV